MILKILLPTEVLLNEKVTRVTAEAENGFFTLLPKHIDFVTALVPSIFAYATPDEEEHFLALDRGILVKRGRTVQVSAYRAVRGESLEQLQNAVEMQLRQLGESEKKARSVLARLEMDTLRRFTRLGGDRLE